jgi:hypothetical protein
MLKPKEDPTSSDSSSTPVKE